MVYVICVKLILWGFWQKRTEKVVNDLLDLMYRKASILSWFRGCAIDKEWRSGRGGKGVIFIHSCSRGCIYE